MSCGVGRRPGSDLALLWCRLAATALIRPLAWGPPYAAGSGPRKGKKTKKKKKKEIEIRVIPHTIKLSGFYCNHRIVQPVTISFQTFSSHPKDISYL